MFAKFLTAVATALGTLILLWAIGWIWFCASIVLMEPKPLEQKLDSIIVFTGGKNRVEEGLKLLNSKKAGKLFISGVHEQVKKEDLIKVQPLPCCISLGYSATDTEGNAKESAQWAANNDIQSAYLVTSNYHMPRARLFFDNVVPNVKLTPYPIKPENFGPWSTQFWSTTFGEYNKTLAAWIKLSVDRESVK